MSRYWIFLNDEVAGPYTVDDLIRLRGFSREARVCLEQPDGGTAAWMNVADLPELAAVFRAARELAEAPEAPPTVAKPVQKPPPVVVRASPARSGAPGRPQDAGGAGRRGIALLVLAAMAAGGGAIWTRRSVQQAEEARAAQRLVENTTLPNGSLARTVSEYLVQIEADPRWDVERAPEGLYRVTASWFDRTRARRSYVLAFEVNLQALSVRGLNTMAQTLLENGVRRPESTAKPAPAQRPATAEPKRPTPEQQFRASLETRKVAIENGDYAAVWALFSRRKQSEMIQAGMSESGYVHLNALRYKLENGLKQAVLKTKAESPGVRLVLLKEVEPEHGEVFLKQRWIREDGQWRLDEEEKRGVPDGTGSEGGRNRDASSDNPEKRDIPVRRLPGLSN